MEGTYPVFWKGSEIGTVTIFREGLYYRLMCRCRLVANQMLQLILSDIGGDLDLGMMIPSGDYLESRLRIPVKRLSVGSASFHLRSREVPEEFVAVAPDQPFPYLDQLERCVYRQSNGNYGVRITKNFLTKNENNA